MGRERWSRNENLMHIFSWRVFEGKRGGLIVFVFVFIFLFVHTFVQSIPTSLNWIARNFVFVTHSFPVDEALSMIDGPVSGSNLVCISLLALSLHFSTSFSLFPFSLSAPSFPASFTLQPFAQMMALAMDFHQIRKLWKWVKIWAPPDCEACYILLRGTPSI